MVLRVGFLADSLCCGLINHGGQRDGDERDFWQSVVH